MEGILNGKLVLDLNPDKWKGMGMIYEVLRVTEGRPLFLAEHLERMARVAQGLDIEEASKGVYSLIQSAPHGISKNIFLSFSQDTKELALFFIDSFYPPDDWYAEGIDVNILKIRRQDPTKKIYDAEYKAAVSRHLQDTSVFETLISDSGLIKEGSRSNVFFMGKEGLVTPPVLDVLPGITRMKVIEAAREAGIPFTERPVLLKEVPEFQGAFLTGTSIDLLPIRKIGENQLPTLSLPLYRQLLQRYRQMKEEDLADA